MDIIQTRFVLIKKKPNLSHCHSHSLCLSSVLTVTLCLSSPFRSRTMTFIAATKMTMKMVRPPTLLLLTATTMLSWQTTSSSTTISTIPTTLFHTATKWLSCNFVNWFPFGSIGFFFALEYWAFFYWLFHNFVRFHLGLLEFWGFCCGNVGFLEFWVRWFWLLDFIWVLRFLLR